jgi:hypothetical protein
MATDGERADRKVRSRVGDAIACSCGGRTRVVNARPEASGNAVWRRRECTVCGKRVTTREVEVDPLGRAARGDLGPLAALLRTYAAEFSKLADAIAKEKRP